MLEPLRVENTTGLKGATADQQPQFQTSCRSCQTHQNVCSTVYGLLYSRRCTELRTSAIANLLTLMGYLE